MFFNALEIEKVQKNHFLIYEEGNEIPYAFETYRMKGSFRENLELWDFPLDYQVWIHCDPIKCLLFTIFAFTMFYSYLKTFLYAKNGNDVKLLTLFGH